MTTEKTESRLPLDTTLRLEETGRYLEGALRRADIRIEHLTTRLREAELGVTRERFIRVMAMQLGQELLPAPAKFDLNEQGALRVCWDLAKALWDSKPEDC